MESTQQNSQLGRSNDSSTAMYKDVSRLKEELGNMTKKMVCHKECARFLVSSLEDIVERQTHELTISTYTFNFDGSSLKEPEVDQKKQQVVKQCLGCPVCSKRFKYRRNLKAHLKMHDDHSSIT